MIYVVSGMARTGTSMMMHALIKGGIPAIYDVGRADPRLQVLKKLGYDSNHDGLFELYKKNLYKKFPDDLDDELVKIQDWQWRELSGEAENGIKVVYMLRDKQSTLKSFMAFTGSSLLKEAEDRYDMQDEYIAEIRERSDVIDVTELWYEEVVRSPLSNFQLLKEVGWPINAEKAAGIVNPAYHHFRSSR
jgi:hypothetical protein